MHFLITSLPGKGKTTFLLKVSSLLNKKKGFYTQEIRHKGVRKGFLLKTFSGKEVIFAQKGLNSKFKVKDYGVNIEDFEKIILEELSNIEDCRFILIDEIGKMELFSPIFKEKVESLLDSSKRVIATISKISHPFIEKIKKRKDFLLVDLDEVSPEEGYKIFQNYLQSFTSYELKKLDRIASQVIGIDEMILMENAGKNSASYIIDLLKKMEFSWICIFCGPGNNGADGLVCARHLLIRGIQNLKIFIISPQMKFSELNIKQQNIIKNMNKEIIFIKKQSDFKDLIHNCSLDGNLLVVDAIFGIGFKNEPSPLTKEIINFINKKSKFTISIDIPSGLDADKGKTQDYIIKSNITLTFLANKCAFLKEESRNYTGQIKVLDLGITLPYLKNYLE